MNESKLQELLSPDYMIEEILEVHRFLYQEIELVPGVFAPYWLHKGKTNKPMAVVDLLAERLFMRRILKRFDSTNVKVIGEETPERELDLREEKRICLLIDMIDGTDLLQRRLSNWCSAIVVFDPQEKDILGAFVGAPRTPPERSGFLYYAIKGQGAFKKRLTERARDEAPIPLHCDPKEIDPETKREQPRTLQDASVCLNGQKSNSLLRLLTLNENNELKKWLRKNINRDKELKKTATAEIRFRYYDLAGIPMMAKMTEGFIDLILDLGGQAPHDLIPGAFIALQAGAIMKKPTGEKLTIEDLAPNLLQPGDERSKVKYILGANEIMVDQMLELLSHPVSTTEEWHLK